MTASDRLKDIEKSYISHDSQVEWLIARVRKLTEALEEIETKTSLFDFPLNEICKKALAE